MNTTINQALRAKSSLLRHLTILSLLCIGLQTTIQVRGNKIDIVSQLLLGVVALYYLWYQSSSRQHLCTVRFGRLVAHVAGFLIVNLSYHLHAFILIIGDNRSIRGGQETLTIDEGWFGVLFGMSTFWGIGLLIHLVASIANRGFEELGS